MVIESLNAEPIEKENCFKTGLWKLGGNLHCLGSAGLL
jgi:hypothetical protein